MKKLLLLLILLTPLMAEVKSFMCGINVLLGGSDKQLMIPDSKIQYLFLLQVQASNKLVNWQGTKFQNYTENSSEVMASSQPRILGEVATINRSKTEIIFNKFNGNLRESIFYEIKSPIEDELVWVESSFAKYLCKKTKSLL